MRDKKVDMQGLDVVEPTMEAAARQHAGGTLAPGRSPPDPGVERADHVLSSGQLGLQQLPLMRDVIQQALQLLCAA
jgi:hypothetical protein